MSTDTTLPAPGVDTAVPVAPSHDGPVVTEATVHVRHGVPHVVVPAPGPVRARLVFRVGMVDEAMPDRGLTHLVEHLVMRAAGRRHIDVGGHTGAWTTGFEASGPAEEVTRFVEDVWSLLADLPTGALDLERRVLGHEAVGRSLPPVVASAFHRFGVTGPGRLWTDETGLGGADVARVRDWVAGRFVRSAAALASTADITPDLSAPLGDGPAWPLPAVAAVRGSDGPTWVGDTGSTAVSLLLPSEQGLDLAVGRLLAVAAEDAVRHDRALAYEVGMDVLPVSPRTSEVTVYAVCAPADQVEVAGLLVAEVRRLRGTGGRPDDLELDRRMSRVVWEHMQDHLEVAAEHAVGLLVGSTARTVAERLDDAEALVAARVGTVVGEAWPTLQVLMQDELDPGLDDVRVCRHDEPPVTGRRHRGNPLAGLLPGARVPLPPSASVTCGADGVTLRLGEDVTTVRWEDVAAVLREPDALRLVGRDGASVLLLDGSFLGWRRLRREVEARVDPSLVLDVPS
ncbi:hypothetical protein [Aquipuribacter hungaricus]|uniref:Rhodanese domain-containing protein n=1 Tax=Aquipuribacter hungaricus TaxID=545624 RepID=A0ABV7WH98_9MICO